MGLGVLPVAGERRSRALWAGAAAALGALALWAIVAWRPLPSPALAFQPLLPLNASASPDPYPVHSLPPSDLTTLINLQHFSFLSTPPLCNSSAPLAIVLVHSAPSNHYHRQMIRKTWGRDIPVVFLIGDANSTDLNDALEYEQLHHRDLVIGNFVDSYRNMTYKHVMGLKWVTYHCPSAKYILKVDDDVFVNTYLLEVYLSNSLSPLGARKLILCDVLEPMRVIRTYRSKWRVSPAEYPGRWYPRYCYGWAVIYSPDVVFTLYTQAQKTQYFWVDDVHVTGTLAAQANLTQSSLGSLARGQAFTDSLIKSGDSRNDFIFGLTSPEHFLTLWNMIDRLEHTKSSVPPLLP